MNSYRDYVNTYSTALTDAASFPLGGYESLPVKTIPADAPTVLVFAPHPDDECIIGALPLRMHKELQWNVVNVAVTQGSNKDRQDGRWEELSNAMTYLGWKLIPTIENGLEKVNCKTRDADPNEWTEKVAVIADIIKKHAPTVIIMPHNADWNSTHIGTHYLVTDALKTLDNTFSCLVVETEFWGAMDDPNLMIESSEEDVAELVTATSFHVKEVERNPYHLRLPPWMQDNVRRGGELVGGQGGEAPSFPFATLYRLTKWENGELQRFYEGGKVIARGVEALKAVFKKQ